MCNVVVVIDPCFIKAVMILNLLDLDYMVTKKFWRGFFNSSLLKIYKNYGMKREKLL